jgi:gamma-glutamyl-gamma-aminobutyrate hydrolase PuuD
MRGFAKAKGVVDPNELKGASLLILQGGEDISPSLYNQRVGRAFATQKPSERDRVEVELIKRAVAEGIPILGICRGAQLLCAVGGGSLWQHVDRHVGNHEMEFEGNLYDTNSCHHQMMRPTKDMQVLAAVPARSPNKWAEDYDPIEDTNPEPEIVFMPKMKALGVQGHPEWLTNRDDLVKITKQLVEKHLNVYLGR